MSRRGRRGGRVEYGRGGYGGGGGGGGGPPTRGMPGSDPHDIKLNGNSKDSGDPSSFKACQFYLHEFKTTEPEARKPLRNIIEERAEVITEIQ